MFSSTFPSMAYTAIVWENAAAALQHGMTVEVWFQEYRPPVLAEAGLIVFVSTPASNRNRSIEYMEVERWTGPFQGMICPRSCAGQRVRLGTLGQYDPRSRGMNDFKHYIAMTKQYPLPSHVFNWSHFWYGISLCMPTDPQPGRPVFHAVDVYMQPMGMLHTEWYLWYIATDITDPLAWYEARKFFAYGARDFTAAPTPPPAHL